MNLSFVYYFQSQLMVIVMKVVPGVIQRVVWVSVQGVVWGVARGV